MQERLYEANAEWADGLDALAQMPRELRADGDMELEAKEDFVVPSCTRCGGRPTRRLPRMAVAACRTRRRCSETLRTFSRGCVA